MVIELDGMIHLSRHEYDIERIEFLKSTGLRILRFRNVDIEDRMQWVMQTIKDCRIIFPLGETGKGGKNIRSKHIV